MSATTSAAANAAPPPYNEARELRVALWLTALVLVTLTLVKPLGGIRVVGTIGFTIAAAMQLYLPMWRCEKLNKSYAFIGLHLQSLSRDLKVFFLLCAVTFPPYIFLHHLYMTAAHDWAMQLHLTELVHYLPQRVLGPDLPHDVVGWAKSTWWLLQTAATHSLGVALPEETFYRGYLLPRLEQVWPPAHRVLGVPIGRAAVLVAFFFAAGHFLGEWNPLRWGPFFPALVFAWQRNATGSVVSAVGYHAACNVLGEVLFALYRPI